MSHPLVLLKILQLASPALPVGAYSYSEGLEFLVHRGTIHNQATLADWLRAELGYGSIRLDGAMLVRGYQAMTAQDWQKLVDWNAWLSASREAEELRLQSWQMGRSLLRLLRDLRPALEPIPSDLEAECHFAIAYAIAAVHWQIDLPAALLGYLQSWGMNLVSAGVKLIPLGQTAGQQLLLDLQPAIVAATEVILSLPDTHLESCSWGLGLASMAHETQYSRLFRS
jgi:urease accessory protein